ncbi:efflux transporter outer membrane subunit [Rhizobium sp. BK176]|uniref:efflux transporter outer membrane subunit n=1 Tax=Rhizobium sp. BK176 TaxID=2587071 RepID=UPI002169CDF4|nr:efflux transporter outer membrane subunit [Rhizobium sp. BK176]MCS4090176.1 NodT family efflux transporter outer membrane factor (OMF) lipoprotein [Rhizobium sp. BK176]
MKINKNTARSETRSRLASIIGAAVMAATLASCTTAQDYSRPKLTMPSSWSFAGKKDAPKPPELADWWKSFNDPTLDSLVAKAVDGNLDVATARSRVAEARASLKQAGGDLYPSAAGSSSAKRAKSQAGTANAFQAGLDASWEIDLFGANQRSVEAARFGLNAAEEDLRATTLTLIGDIASNYVAARGYQARHTLAAKSADLQRDTLQITRDKESLGAGTGLDVANAEGQTYSTEANIPELAASYSETVNRLSVLTGEAPGALNRIMEKGRGRVPTARLAVKTGIPADLLNARPDVRVAEYKLSQAKARKGVADANRYPSVTLTGSISTSAADFGDLARGSSIGWGFGPAINVPIFNAGKLKAAAEVAKAQQDQAFIAYQSAVLGALEDVENASVSLTQQRRRNAKLSASVGSYRQAAELSRTLYREGASEFVNVLTAERSLYSSEDGLIQSRVALANDFIALNKALGGGWNGKTASK